MWVSVQHDSPRTTHPKQTETEYTCSYVRRKEGRKEGKGGSRKVNAYVHGFIIDASFWCMCVGVECVCAPGPEMERENQKRRKEENDGTKKQEATWFFFWVERVLSLLVALSRPGVARGEEKGGRQKTQRMFPQTLVAPSYLPSFPLAGPFEAPLFCSLSFRSSLLHPSNNTFSVPCSFPLLLPCRPLWSNVVLVSLKMIIPLSLVGRNPVSSLRVPIAWPCLSPAGLPLFLVPPFTLLFSLSSSIKYGFVCDVVAVLYKRLQGNTHMMTDYSGR